MGDGEDCIICDCRRFFAMTARMSGVEGSPGWGLMMGRRGDLHGPHHKILILDLGLFVLIFCFLSLVIFPDRGLSIWDGEQLFCTDTTLLCRFFICAMCGPSFFLLRGRGVCP